MPKGVAAKTGKGTQYGRRKTVDQRLAMRDRGNISQGRQAGWADEALNYYLDGIPVDEILDCFTVGMNTFYNAIAKAALYRLMLQHQAQRLEEMPELRAEEKK